MVRALCSDTRERQRHVPSRELDWKRIVVPVVGKRIKAFKKWYEDEMDPGREGENDDPEGTNENGGFDGLEEDK